MNIHYTVISKSNRSTECSIYSKSHPPFTDVSNIYTSSSKGIFTKRLSDKLDHTHI